MPYRILLWGTGHKALDIIQHGSFSEHLIEGFVDTYKKTETFMNCPVFCPEELPEIIGRVDYLILVNDYFFENIALCTAMGIGLDKIVITQNIDIPLYREMFLKLNDISQDLYHQEANRPHYVVVGNEFDAVDPDRLVGKGKYSDYPRYMEDYFRYRTFELTARRIMARDVPGAVAELGVFRGVFAALINEVFYDRKLYLFDTFEGFSGEEIKRENELGRCCGESFLNLHKDTSVDWVLKNMPHPENCIICKGLFPESVSEEAAGERYSFVSLDVDFEESSYQGLCFFYPRLSVGGALFLHDYTARYLKGVQEAVKRFEQDSGIQLKAVPLADRAGTLVIVK